MRWHGSQWGITKTCKRLYRETEKTLDLDCKYLVYTGYLWQLSMQGHFFGINFHLFNEVYNKPEGILMFTSQHHSFERFKTRFKYYKVTCFEY